MMKSIAILVFLAVGSLALHRVPLHRMKSARRTIEDLKFSRSAIAKRWMSKTGDFPEEPLDNYLDVLGKYPDHLVILFVIGPILRTN